MCCPAGGGGSFTPAAVYWCLVWPGSVGCWGGQWKWQVHGWSSLSNGEKG